MSEETVNDELAGAVAEAPSISIEDIEAALRASAEPVEAEFAGDPKATWDYWSELTNPPEGPSDDLVWARLRYRRNAALDATDSKVSIPDAPWDKTPILAYRQSLRDLPGSTVDPRKAAWPTRP